MGRRVGWWAWRKDSPRRRVGNRRETQGCQMEDWWRPHNVSTRFGPGQHESTRSSDRKLLYRSRHTRSSIKKHCQSLFIDLVVQVFGILVVFPPCCDQEQKVWRVEGSERTIVFGVPSVRSYGLSRGPQTQFCHRKMAVK